MIIISKKKILFFGLGSIGTRHLNLILKNYDFDLYAYRTNKNSAVSNIKNIYDIAQALKIKPDVAFITNPTNLHIKTAFLCLNAGIKHLFIEKPLSHSLDNLDILLNEFKKKNAIVYVGYSMRHNPVLKRLKEIIEKRKNEIFYALTISSSYLPSWRPRRDYRNNYSAKREMGGGIILELIHEFDYNEWFFGKIDSISGIYGKISKLEINVEDFCDINLKFKNRMKAFIHLDYFSYKDERKVKIMTINEEIIADLIKKEILIIDGKSIKKENFNFERNDTFENQLEYFFDGIENESKDISNLKDAKELLEKLLNFKIRNRMSSI